MQTVNVELGPRSYPIYIGAGIIGRSELYAPGVRASQVMVVSNETVAPLYLDRLLGALDGYCVDRCLLRDGEQYKTLAELDRIFDALLDARHNRTTTLVALGGGVVGDMTGFAAACYQRGVDFIQVPTTLLAQVDSSVGGKTGVNHRLGKNMIGAFHQPRCVIADTATLQTLPPRELGAGIAEVIKCGLIADTEFFAWLESNIEALVAREPAALAFAIARSCENKARIVAADEREGGQRALLNLGHTFGHAIETGQGYGRWLHGEAVAAGIALAASLSERLGWLGADDVARVESLLARAGLPTRPPAKMSGAQFTELMAVDKKVIDGRLRLILLESIGRAVICDGVGPAEVEAMVDGL